SPDKNYFISGNADLVAGFVFNGFDLYEIKNKKIHLIGRRELSNWGPEKIAWINNSSLLVQRIISDTTKPDKVRSEYVKLIMNK
ncbi:MAG TPA: hypothetical protein VNX68_10450, partial [Nitrosopumilaceae archaeon]|nr:hypothetical protein [Nitrosopumilaceae archaeon]